MFYPVLFLLLLSVVGFYLNKNKSVYLSKNQKLASLPAYYGYLAFLYIFVPAIIIWLGLLIGKSFILQNYLILTLGDSLSVMNSDEINLFMSKVKNLSLGISFGNETDLEKFAAEKIISFDKIFSLLTYLVLTLSSILAFLIARKKVIPNFKLSKIRKPTGRIELPTSRLRSDCTATVLSWRCCLSKYKTQFCIAK